MSFRIGLPLVTVAVLSLPLLAQTRPNLAGTWELVPDKSVPPRPASAQPAPPMTISQDANTVTLSAVLVTPMVSRMTMTGSGQVTNSQAPQEREVYPFTQTYMADGVEHPDPDKLWSGPPAPPASMPSTSPGARVSIMTNEQSYRANWTGTQFVLTIRAVSKVDPPSPTFVPTTRVTRKTYSIDSDGFLVIESLTTSEPASNGAQPTPTRSVYRKSS